MIDIYGVPFVLLNQELMYLVVFLFSLMLVSYISAVELKMQ